MRKILLTGGIGDVFALESREPFAEVGTIYWATRARGPVQPVLETVYPHIRHHNVFDEFDRDSFPAFYNGDQAQAHFRKKLPADVEDWSIEAKFKENMPYVGSRTLSTPLAKIQKPARRYWVIQHDTPANNEDHRRFRSLDRGDWKYILRMIHEAGVKGVVLNTADATDPPGDPSVIDLRGKTTLAESIEILKAANGYVGIDSWLSILAAQLFPAEALLIRVVNSHALQNRSTYWAPHKSPMGFVKESLWRPKPETIDTIMNLPRIRVELLEPRLVDNDNRFAGDVVEVFEHVGQTWIRHGIARKYEPKPFEKKVEKAVRKTASKRNAVKAV